MGGRPSPPPFREAYVAYVPMSGVDRVVETGSVNNRQAQLDALLFNLHRLLFNLDRLLDSLYN